MKLGLFLLPAAFLLAFAALIVTCGGDADTLTLDEYFEQFEAIDADVDAQIEAAFAKLPEAGLAEEPFEEAFFADDANLPFFKDLIAVFPRAVGDAIDRMKALDPPSEAENAHTDLIDAAEDLLAAFEEAAGVLDETESMEEAADVMAEFEGGIDAAETAFDTACLALVDIAEANGITVDVTCEDDV